MTENGQLIRMPDGSYESPKDALEWASTETTRVVREVRKGVADISERRVRKGQRAFQPRDAKGILKVLRQLEARLPHAAEILGGRLIENKDKFTGGVQSTILKAGRRAYYSPKAITIDGVKYVSLEEIGKRELGAQKPFDFVYLYADVMNRMDKSRFSSKIEGLGEYAEGAECIRIKISDIPAFLEEWGRIRTKPGVKLP